MSSPSDPSESDARRSAAPRPVAPGADDPGPVPPGADDATPGGDTGSAPETAARLAEPDLDPAERRRLMGRLVAQTASRTTQSGWLPRPQQVIGAVIDLLSEIAERLPVRDLGALRKHFAGLNDEELASRLIRNASRASAAVGAAGGGIAAVEWAVPPTLLTAPVLLTAETVAVAAIELKLIGELHEIYGPPVRGSAMERATALLSSWAGRRGVNPLTPGRGMGAVLSTAARRELRERLIRRFGRNLTTLAPLLAGAAVGAELNRRATRTIGEEIRKDLRGRAARVIEGPSAPDQGAVAP